MESKLTEFNALLPTHIKSFDPVQLLTATHVIAFNQIYDTLFYIDHERLRVVPDIIDYYSFNEELTTYKFTLKSGLKFHDGSPLTTKDIAFTLERVLKEKYNEYKELADIRGSGGFYRGEEGEINGIVIIDELNFEVYLKKPSTMFLYVLSLVDFSILPSKYKNEMETGVFFENPIGSGAFMFNGSDEKSVQLLKFEHALVEPEIDVLTFFYMDEEEAKREFLAGRIDKLYPYHLTEEELEDNPDVFVHPYKVYYTVFLAFNVEKPPFTKRINRKIFKNMCNIEGLQGKDIGPTISPATGYIPHGMPGFLEEEEFEEEVMGDEALIFNQKIKIALSNRVDGLDVITKHLRKIFEENDIDVELVVENINDLVKNMKKGMYHGTVLNNYYQYPDSYSILRLFKSNSIYNIWEYKNPQIDELLGESFITPVKTDRAKIYSEINKLLCDDVVTINLFFGGVQTATFRKEWEVPPMNFIGEFYLKYRYIRTRQQ